MGAAFWVAAQNTNNSENIRRGSPACGCTPCMILLFPHFSAIFWKIFQKNHKLKGPFEWLCQIQTIPKIFPGHPLHVAMPPASSVSFSHFFAILKEIFKKRITHRSGGCLLSNCAKYKQFHKYSPGVPHMWLYPLHHPFCFPIFSHFKKNLSRKSQAEGGVALWVAVQNTTIPKIFPRHPLHVTAQSSPGPWHSTTPWHRVQSGFNFVDFGHIFFAIHQGTFNPYFTQDLSHRNLFLCSQTQDNYEIHKICNV